MIRIRWSDPEPDSPTTLIPWPWAAVITATLFLNFPFWGYSLELGAIYTLPVNAGVIAIVALLITALFFAGPALASHAAQRPLFDVVACSIGSIPAYCLRICCVWFLVRWVAGVIAWPALYVVGNIPPYERWAILFALLGLLFITGLQSFQTSAKLALFSCKLGLAVLAAALIRVHHGWPAIYAGFPNNTVYSPVSIVWHGLSELALGLAPVLFLAADFGYRMRGRKQAAMAAVMGVAMPLWGTLLIASAISVATYASPYYTPSLNPDVGMALVSKAAQSALPGRIMIITMTAFGAVRFGARAIATAVATPVHGRWFVRVVFGCLSGVIAWCCVGDWNPIQTTSGSVTDVCLAAAAAVVTADFVSGKRRPEPVPKIDWIGFTALLAGFATAYIVQFWILQANAEAGLLPLYAVAFAVCTLGRRFHSLLP